MTNPHVPVDRPHRATMLVAALLLLAAPAAAQDELEARRVIPGWVLTPTVSLGVTFDDNPVLAGRGDPSPDDTITNVRPGLDLSFTAKHTFFGVTYRGSLVRYRTLDQYDSYDQGGTVELRHEPSRRVTLTLRDTFSVAPTTDTVDVAGVPFSRTGTRQNSFDGGATFAVTERLNLSGGYTFRWIDFDPPGGVLTPLLQGGRSHGVNLGARQQLSERWEVGATYTLESATVGDPRLLDGGEEQFTIQNVEGVASWRAAPTVTIEGGFGISYLGLPSPEGSRTGPAGHVRVRKRTEYALFSAGAMRSFVPAFGFGGSLRNQEIFADVRVPFARKRAYVQGQLAWRDSEPVLEGELGITAAWVETVVGYAFLRWLRAEAFYAGVFQDTVTVAGGRIDRNRIGVRVVTAQPVRLQ
jgi:hypothetical protein